MVYRDPSQTYMAVCSKAIYHADVTSRPIDEEDRVHRDQAVPGLGWYSTINGQVVDHPEDVCVDSHGRIMTTGHFYTVRNSVACSVCGVRR